MFVVVIDFRPVTSVGFCPFPIQVLCHMGFATAGNTIQQCSLQAFVIPFLHARPPADIQVAVAKLVACAIMFQRQGPKIQLGRAHPWHQNGR